MKKFLLASALAFAATSAHAADPVFHQAAPSPAYYSVYDWTGFYVGVNAGGGWSRISSAGGSANLDGWLLGAHAGFNAQAGNIVYGVEGDLGHRWNQTALVGQSARTTWEGSLRARLGYAIDRTLLYGTGGVAFTSLRFDAPAGSARRSYTGWTIGAGVEHAFTDNWSARLEYRYTDFGRQTYPAGATVRLTDHAVRVGVSYKF